ncbi:MAG TPA: hypothetical protein VMY42_16900 [Thermoguttaceae bacterium]|nr:hypothetical protein [Thermoguttaceae bacterium]
MRSIAGLLLILLGSVWLAAELPSVTPSAAGNPHSDWRRTRQGWEPMSCWAFENHVEYPTLHPMVVGLLELFLALAALIAFSKPPDRRPRKPVDSMRR